MFRFTARSCSTCQAALRRSSVAECETDRSVAQGDRRIGLEVEPLGDLAPGLVDRVAHLCRSTSLTMSNENWSLAMWRIVPPAGAGCPGGSLSSEVHQGRMPERPKGGL